MRSPETVGGARLPGKAKRRLQRLILERRYGMRRGALRDVDLRDIGYDAPDRVYEHIPSPWGVLGRILRRREITPDDVFIDVGCGMGPVMVEAAARYPFRRVIGIDVVPEFTRVAEDTVNRARPRLRCKDVEVITEDILEYEIPDDVSLVYMADPFRAQLFDATIAKLIASVDRNPRRLRIIYNMPVEGGRLERTGRARLVRYGRRRNRPWETAPDLAMYEIEPRGARPRVNGRIRLVPSGPRWQALTRRRPPGRARIASGPGGDRTGETMLRVASDPASGSRVAFAGSTEDLDALRTDFEQQHNVKLPGFLGGPLLDRIRAYVEEGEFHLDRFGDGQTDLRMEAGKAAELLALLTNDGNLFDLVRTISGCRRIGSFDAHLHRQPPGSGHAEFWHGEIFGHGMVAMSIDLSERPYPGGVLELRDRYSGEILDRVNTAPGDALVVRLAPFLQRRVTAVEGDLPRTVYAGRFMRFRPDGYSKLARPRSAVRGA